MEMEQWLEEAMVITNRSLHLMPSNVFKQSLESCRRSGVSLVAIAGAGNRLGLVDEKKLLELRERIPEPGKTPLRQDDVTAMQQTCRREIDNCRLWMNCMVGIVREIPVVMDLQPANKKTGERITGVIGGLVEQVMRNNREAGE